MKGLLLPLYCLVVLGPHLSGALGSETNTTGTHSATTVGDDLTTLSTPGPSSPAPTPPPVTKPTSKTTTTTTAASRPVNNGPFEFYSISECRPVTLVAGGLILACFILLVSTLMLACRVCRLSRRLRTLSSSFDLVGSTENCTVTAKQAMSTAEAKETTVLLSDVGRAQEDLANGAPKEEVQEGEPAAAGGGADGEEAPAGENKEAPVAAASQPQEDVTSSQSAAASEGAEEPKDVV